MKGSVKMTSKDVVSEDKFMLMEITIQGIGKIIIKMGGVKKFMLKQEKQKKETGLMENLKVENLINKYF